MLSETVRAALASALAGCLTYTLAAGPAIGLVLARGSFRLDDATVYRSATLFEGARIQTAGTPSELQLNTGARFELAGQSRGTVYRDRLVLEQGGGLLEGSSYPVEAKRLRIAPAVTGAQARVALDARDRVLVAAVKGPVRVTTADGLLLANIAAGRALAFEAHQAGASGPVKLTGVVKKRQDRYFLTDETTGVTVELVGEDMERNVGKRVEVAGSVMPGVEPAAGASQVVRVTAIQGAAAAAGAAAAVAGGVSKAVIAGIVITGAAAGTVIGLVAAGEEKESASR